MIKRIKSGILALLVCLLLAGCEVAPPQSGGLVDLPTGDTADLMDLTSGEGYTADSIPPYSGEPYVALNNNVPTFTADEMTTNSYEFYSELDDLKRCGVTEDCICTDPMPT